MWTCMDNWSWLNAYKNRYGFIAVDLDDDAKRTIKKKRSLVQRNDSK